MNLGNTLLILGNGIDLQAKLKSDFTSFMDYIEMNDREFKENNFWFALLEQTYLNKQQAYAGNVDKRHLKVCDEMQSFIGVNAETNWMDIENFIVQVLTNNTVMNKLKEYFNSSIKGIYNNFSRFSCENDGIPIKLYVIVQNSDFKVSVNSHI